jgi:hypothetical protein
MPKQKKDHSLAPGEPGTSEATSTENNTAETAGANDEASAESQVASARSASDCPEATAASPARHDATGNPDLPGQTTDANPSPADPLAGVPNPQPNGDAEAAPSKDESGNESQVTPASPDSPEAMASRQVRHNLYGISEWLRRGDGKVGRSELSFSAQADTVSVARQIIARSEYDRDPVKQIPFPSRREAYGTTRELFTKIKLIVAEQTQVSNRGSALLTSWIFPTWFQDILPIAPGLAITGWAHQGDRILRTLQAFCYHPFLVAGMTSTALNDISWETKPTLLIYEPSLSMRMKVLLGSSTSRGYLASWTPPGCGRSRFDYFGSKAVYLGEDPPMKPMLQNYLHINASPRPGIERKHAPLLSESLTQRFQNQLLNYRLENLAKVSESNFCASGLSPEVTAIANAFGQCIVDAPDLREELVALLTSYSDQQIAERLDDLGLLCLSAFLTLCHQGKTKILVGEIADEVNRNLKARDEKLQYSPESVGRKLTKVGVPSRRLGGNRNGFVMDRATQVLLHEITTDYGCVGLTEDKENLHCRLCE